MRHQMKCFRITMHLLTYHKASDQNSKNVHFEFSSSVLWQVAAGVALSSYAIVFLARVVQEVAFSVILIRVSVGANSSHFRRPRRHPDKPKAALWMSQCTDPKILVPHVWNVLGMHQGQSPRRSRVEHWCVNSPGKIHRAFSDSLHPA